MIVDTVDVLIDHLEAVVHDLQIRHGLAVGSQRKGVARKNQSAAVIIMFPLSLVHRAESGQQKQGVGGKAQINDAGGCVVTGVGAKGDFGQVGLNLLDGGT